MIKCIMLASQQVTSGGTDVRVSFPWSVNADRHEVRVTTPHGQRTYTAGQEIPLFFGGAIAVDEIFR